MKVLTVNIHKGFSFFNRNFVLPQLKTAVSETKADIVFLQEVIGEDLKKQEKYSDWPESSHYEFLADQIWPEYAYAKNAVFPEKHYGNAILSRYPIESSKQINVSTNRFEQRGFLYS
ncbi:MAG: EEP domain-containing protein, partial [Candidatus Omnitrophica bacterium]|nr:EEP domain-containing protein [Candidatus Omnitrophota bacterium]